MNIGEIHKKGDFIIVNGPAGFLAKCYGGCDYLTNLTVPDFTGYYSDKISLIDTNNIYLISHVGFPHYGYVFKSEDVGNSWVALYDTTDFLFTDFMMFDTLNGFVLSTFYKSVMTNNDGAVWATGVHPLIITSASLKINDSTAIIGANRQVNNKLIMFRSNHSSVYIPTQPIAG